MITRIIAELGPWSWLVLGLLLLTVEIFAPGAFMLWIGIAALAVGAASLALWSAAFWTWQVQVVAFLLLAALCVWLGRKYMGGRTQADDQPLLNRRSLQMVGRTATLAEPITNGRGRIQLGDTLWRVAGPDLPVGAQVKVVGVSDTDLDLIVEKVG